MQQYHFMAKNQPVRATAATAEIARLQLALVYGQVEQEPFDVQPAHRTYGEIDCSDFVMGQIDWLRKEAAKV
jgi:hypothetical protein